MKKRLAMLLNVVCVVGTVVMMTGCSQQAATSTASAEGAKYLLPAEPADAQEIIAVRESAKDGDEVTLVGRIGGSSDPWTENRATFTLVDNSLKACSDIPGDACPKPWDYCCEPNLKTSTASIKIVDESGELVKADPRKLLDVTELSTVVVQGKAQRNEDGDLTVLATHVFVKKK